MKTVSGIDSTFAILLGALTFTTPTIGINIVANFTSPAWGVLIADYYKLRKQHVAVDDLFTMSETGRHCP